MPRKRRREKRRCWNPECRDHAKGKGRPRICILNEFDTLRRISMGFFFPKVRRMLQDYLKSREYHRMMFYHHKFNYFVTLLH